MSSQSKQGSLPECLDIVLLPLMMQHLTVNSRRFRLNLPSSAPLKSRRTINFNPLIAYARTRTSSSDLPPSHSTPFRNHVGRPESGFVISDRFSPGFISGAGMWSTWHVNNILGVIYSQLNRLLPLRPPTSDDQHPYNSERLLCFFSIV